MSPPGDHQSGLSNGHTLEPSRAAEEAQSLLFNADDNALVAQEGHNAPQSPEPSPAPGYQLSSDRSRRHISHGGSNDPSSSTAAPSSTITTTTTSSSPFPPLSIPSSTTTSNHPPPPPTNPRLAPPRRQSSLSKPPPDGTPKTPRTQNRVRFDLSSSAAEEEEAVNYFSASNGHSGSGQTTTTSPRSPRSPRSPWSPSTLFSPSSWGNSNGNGSWGRGSRGGNGGNGGNGGDDDDESDWDASWVAADRRDGGGQRERLLEGMEAPSVRVANSLDMGERYGGRHGSIDLTSPRHHHNSNHPSAGEAGLRAAPKSGLGSAFMNMANSIIGAGIIGQPYAFRQAGLLAGTALLVGLTVMVDWTIRLIVVNSKLSGATSFQSTMERCFGKAGLIAISLAQWAFAFGGMLAFCVIIGDTIPQVMAAVWPGLAGSRAGWMLVDRRFVVIVMTLGISWPLSLYRDIAKLAKASTLALISMLVILITVITQGARVDSADRGSLKGSLGVNSGIFQAIGVISFDHNSLLIYGSLQTPTLDRFAKVTHFSTGISMFACLTMALAGFLTFGDKTEGNVLNNFPRDNIMVNIARLCFGLNMLTTLPLEAFVCREVMLNYFHPTSPHSMPRHFFYTTALVFSCVLLSLLTCDLGAVLELIGATSACAIAYIMPPLCYIKLSKRSWRTFVAWAIVAFGVCVLIVSSVLAITRLVHGGEEGKKCT